MHFVTLGGDDGRHASFESQLTEPDAEEEAKNEEGPAIKEVQERLRRIERVLENLTENIAKLK